MSRSETGAEGAAVAILDALADIVVGLEADGRIHFVNRAAERIVGIPPEDTLGHSFLEFIAPEDHAHTVAIFRKVVETGEDHTARFQVVRPDGLRLAFEACLRSSPGHAGARTITAVCRDVTQHEATRVLEQLRRSQYGALVESGLSATAIATPDGRIVYRNRRFRALFDEASHVDALAPSARHAQRQALANAWFDSMREDATGTGRVDLERAEPSGAPTWITLQWNGFQSESGERLLALQASEAGPLKQMELAFTRLARGVDLADDHATVDVLAALAGALDLDRLVLARREPARPDALTLVAGWQDGAALAGGPFALEGLPEATAAEGALCIHPAGVPQLLPAVAERIGPRFESFAGIGLIDPDSQPPASARADRNRTVVGVLAGYARRPLADPERVRELLASAAAPFGRALAQATRRVRSAAQDPAGRSAPAEVGRELLHRVIEQSADLVFVCDLDATILFANAAAGRHLADPRLGSLVGRSLLELLTPGDATRLRSEILPHLAPGQPWRGELWLTEGCASDAGRGARADARDDVGKDARGSGTARQGTEAPTATPTEATVQLVCDRPVAGRRGTTTHAHLAVTLRDIGARRQIEAALQESERSLAQARKLESVGRLAGGIAHDFNNLLTAIIGYSDLVLQELPADHAARPDIEEILRAAERAGGLTRQLLAFSRRQVLRPERVDLNAVVADIDRMLRRLIGEDIELVTELAGGLEAILADPGQIEQVIVNLVVNARDAMPRGGRLELETANFACRMPQRLESGLLAPGSYVTLRVTDTGIGMDEGTRAQIFEPFFTTKSASGGTGLGLATVYGIVSQSRGQIAVESRLGEGSTFTVYLPTANEELAEPAPEETLVGGRGRETVLLVEDSRPVLELIERTLHRRGYTVLPAESATAALRHGSRYEGPIDLMLSDVVLPRMSGPEIAERMRQLRPGIRVLFMSGFTDETLIQHGLARSDERLLEKPFSRDTLLARVRQALDQTETGASEEPEAGNVPRGTFASKSDI